MQRLRRFGRVIAPYAIPAAVVLAIILAIFWRAWTPIEGERNSARLPDYRRLDVRLTRLFSLPEVGGVPQSRLMYPLKRRASTRTFSPLRPRLVKPRA